MDSNRNRTSGTRNTSLRSPIIGPVTWSYPTCPFCHSGNLRSEGTASGMFIIRCYGCQASGPSRLTREEAEQAWKSR